MKEGHECLSRVSYGSYEQYYSILGKTSQEPRSENQRLGAIHLALYFGRYSGGGDQGVEIHG